MKAVRELAAAPMAAGEEGWVVDHPGASIAIAGGLVAAIAGIVYYVRKRSAAQAAAS